MRKLTLVLGLVCVGAAQAVETVYPQKTIRFPGSGVTHFGVSGKTLVAGTCWNREEGGAVFDLSDPANPVYRGGFKSCGYVTSDPVMIPGTSCALFTHWHSANIVDFSDSANARILQTLAFNLKERTALEARMIGEWIFLQGDRRCTVYRWNPKYGRAELVESFEHDKAKFPQPPAPDPKARFLPEALRKTARSSGDCVFVTDIDRTSVRSFGPVGGRMKPIGERFYVYGLSSVAVDGGKAYVYTPTFRCEHALLTLDLAKEGIADFEPTAVIEPRDPKAEYFTMGMLPSGSVEVRDGRPLAFRSAANMCVDGARIAVAESSRLAVVERPARGKDKVISEYFPTNMLHATGVALRGGTLFAIVVPKPKPNMSFLSAPVPDRAYLLALDVTKPQAELLSRTELPSAVACVLAADDVLYVPGIAHGGEKAVFTVVDVADPAKPSVVARLDGMIEGSSYHIKRYAEGIFFNDGIRVKRLATDDVRRPAVAAEYRSNREIAYGVDDFTVAAGKVYALSHSSLAVYGVKGEGAVPPERHEDAPAWSEKPFEGVAFSTAKTAEANGRRYVCRDALGLEIDGKLVRLPEGNAEAVVVGTDGTAYVAAGVAMLAVFTPDGRVEMVRRKGPRWNYNYAYATGVALSDDGKTVYVDAGEGEGCYLAYQVEKIAPRR